MQRCFRGRPLWNLIGVALLAGCAQSGGIAMRATIAGGQEITIPLGSHGIEPAREDGLEVDFASCTLNNDKKLIYGFHLSDSRGRALRRIRVEDVSDDTPILLVDDAQPALKDKKWLGGSKPFEPGDPAVAWVSTITNSLRVFRFTVTLPDGRDVVLLQGSMFLNPMKAVIRQAWGQNY
jgi:hypothetical protein